MTETLESPHDDTGTASSIATIEQNDQLFTIPEENNEEQPDLAEQDTLVFDSESDHSNNEHFDSAHSHRYYIRRLSSQWDNHTPQHSSQNLYMLLELIPQKR